ncbi:MAG: hypothetical protein NT045_09710 [Candidatus Aureabacteria bacterium]|nr:hypothetical protein [Candidatus Auribacterota bacterium]
MRPSQAIRSWRGSYALAIRNIPAVTAIAAFEERRAMHLLGDAFFITEAIPAVSTLADLVQRLPGTARRRLVRDFALFLRTVHSRGVYHGDMKATNILVQHRTGDNFRFYLTDLDFVRTGLRVPRRLAIRALVQLNKSLLDLTALGIVERRLFLRAYLGPRHRDECPRAWKKVRRITERKIRQQQRRFKARSREQRREQ